MRGRYLGLPLVAWLSLAVLIITFSGGAYAVSLSHTLPPTPTLPPGPPHATLLASQSHADMLSGNFVLTSALYRTSLSPVQVFAFYRPLFKKQLRLFGDFTEPVYSTLPSRSPDALQHIPPIFNSPTAHDLHTANYLYTEYSDNPNDVGVAVDMRRPHGPTYVYLEMLTRPTI